jgi:sarcosine oxidase subunit delta
MLLIDCPFCGKRAEIEFRCGGQAHIARPSEPMAVTDAAWANYLFYRDNTKGMQAERWNHIHGCQRWFNVLRDSMTDRIAATYKMGEKRPENPGA